MSLLHGKRATEKLFVSLSYILSCFSQTWGNSSSAWNAARTVKLTFKLFCWLHAWYIFCLVRDVYLQFCCYFDDKRWKKWSWKATSLWTESELRSTRCAEMKWWRKERKEVSIHLGEEVPLCCPPHTPKTAFWGRELWLKHIVAPHPGGAPNKWGVGGAESVAEGGEWSLKRRAP